MNGFDAGSALLGTRRPSHVLGQRGLVNRGLLVLCVLAAAVGVWLFVGGGLATLGLDGSSDAVEGDREAWLDAAVKGETGKTDTTSEAVGLSGLVSAEDMGGIRLRLLAVGTDAPLEGATVRLIAARGSDMGREAASDATGAVLLDRVPPASRYTLHIRAEGLAEVLVPGVSVARRATTDLGDIHLGERIVLRGRVVDMGGKPVAGASVSVYEMRTDALRRGMLFTMVEAAEGVVLPQDSTRSDDKGWFTFSTLDDGRYRLSARSAARATKYEEDVLISRVRTGAVITLVLDKGQTVRGVVRDDQGNPVVGASVRAIRDAGQRFDAGGFVEREETVTDDNGKYVIDTLARGNQYRFGVLAAGFPSTWETQAIAIEHEMEKNFVLARGGRIEGRVIAEGDGQPVEGVEVAAIGGQMMPMGRGGRGAGGGGDGSMGTQRAVTDADGRYALDPMKAGPIFTLTMRKSGWQAVNRSMFSGNATEPVEAGETLVVDATMQRGGRVTGRVIDATTQTPLIGAEIGVSMDGPAAFGMVWTGSPTAYTDADGIYALEGLAAGEYRLTATAPEFATATSSEAVVLGEQAWEGEMDFALTGAGRLIGIVLDGAGEPVAGAKVRASGTEDEEGGGGQGGGGRMMRRMMERLNPKLTASDQHGRFELTGLAPRYGWEAVVTSPGFVESRSARVRLSAGESREVEVVMRPGASISGWVADADGRRLAGARVRAGTLDEDLARRPRLSAWEIQRVLEPSVSITDEEGAFVLQDLQPGLVVVQVEAEDHATWLKRNLRVEYGETRANYQIALQPGHAVSGQVLDATTGKPVANAFVGLNLGGPPPRPGMQAASTTDAGEPASEDVSPALAGQSGADGAFRIENVPPGTYAAYVWFAAGYLGYAAGSESALRLGVLVPGSDEVVLRVTPAPPDASPGFGGGRPRGPGSPGGR